MKSENEIFRIVEAAIKKAIAAIPETETDNLLAALQTYYESGGEFEDFYDTLITAMENTFEVAEWMPGNETKSPPETRYFYIPDIEFPSAIKEVAKSEIGKLPELDYESGNALIVCERSGDKTTLYEFETETEVETYLKLIFGGEIAETEAVETFTAALATITNIGKGGC